MALRGVWQLQKLIVSYCDWGGSSRGISHYHWLFDYTWVQFYNNPPYEYTDDGDTQKLISPWNQWTTTFNATKFYVGLRASLAANGSAGGYAPIDVLNSEILPEVETSSKFGGVMLWSYYYDKISEYSDNITCTTHSAFNVVREPLVAEICLGG